MSNKSRQDPYRRKPPSIDLTSGEFQRGETPESADLKPPPSAAESDPPARDAAAVGETAIEPIAATGLDAKPADTPAEIPAEPSPTSEPKPDDSPALPAGHDESAIADTPVDAAAVAAAETGPVRPSAIPGLGTTNGDATARETAPPQARRGLGSLLAASLLGGVIGAGLAAGADQYLRPAPTDMDQRIAALERRPATPPADTGGLERRIAALETGARTLTEGVAAARTAADGAARQPAGASTPAQPPVDEIARRSAEQATQRIGALDTALKAATDKASAAATAQSVTEIGARLAALQEANRGLQENARQAGVNAGAITDLRTRLDALQTQSQDQAKTGAAALQTLQAKAADQETRLAALGAEAAKLPPALMQAGLRAVVSGQLADSLRAGAALGAPIGAMEKLGVTPAALEPLRPYAASAAPTAATLAAEFRPLADRMAAEPRVSADSFGDKLLRIAEKVVTVKAVGDGSGSDQPALVARIEAALNRGALADAAAAWDRLPETAKSVSADWAARLKARVAADAALRRISSDSLSALSASTR